MQNNFSEIVNELKYALRQQGYDEDQLNEIEKTYFNQSVMNDYHYDGLQFKVNVSFVNHSDNPDPCYNKSGDAGFDLRADLSEEENTYYDSDNDLAVDIYPNEVKMIGTGLYFGLPNSYEMQIRPRSGLAKKHKITVINSPGTIDSNYRGEVKVLLINLDFTNTVKIRHGDRIAQAVIQNVFSENQIYFNKQNELDSTERNDQGFGSSGYK